MTIKRERIIDIFNVDICNTFEGDTQSLLKIVARIKNKTFTEIQRQWNQHLHDEFMQRQDEARWFGTFEEDFGGWG